MSLATKGIVNPSVAARFPRHILDSRSSLYQKMLLAIESIEEASLVWNKQAKLPAMPEQRCPSFQASLPGLSALFNVAEALSLRKMQTPVLAI